MTQGVKQTEETFWDKVDKTSSHSECWPWKAAINSSGTPVVHWGGKLRAARRIAAWLSGLITKPALSNYGPPQKHEGVRMTCKNKSCMNPKHMKVG